ncbi:MAG: DUF4097 domain-containing protein [Pyrinomonadaceae bacterium]|nr:DUF4097 domain-containing protein [Pyrinomonadaceae bacterium]
MNFINRNLPYLAAASLALVIGVAATAVFGQGQQAKYQKEHGFCSNNNYSSDGNVSASDLREMTVTAGSGISVDAGKNGGVSVRGEDRSDVLIRACVQAWSRTDADAKAAVSAIRINTNGTIKAEAANENNWAVSYQILVPRSTNVEVTAKNGGISISDVDGTAILRTVNGGLNLENIAGSVKGLTTNGGVRVTLSGSAWSGSGLDVQTTNGGVTLALPANYAANIETGTVNGGFKSDIPALNVTTEDLRGDPERRSKRVVTAINGGGAPIRVITTNGGVKISTRE